MLREGADPNATFVQPDGTRASVLQGALFSFSERRKKVIALLLKAGARPYHSCLFDCFTVLIYGEGLRLHRSAVFPYHVPAPPQRSVWT